MMTKKIFVKIPEEKQKLILELAKQKKYQHQKYMWMKGFKQTLRNSHSPSGRKTKTNILVRWKKKDWSKGKPHYKKIASIVGVGDNTVRTYILKLHRKYLDELEKEKQKKDKFFEELSEERKVKRMNNFCKKLLYTKGNWIGVRHPSKWRCEKCGKIYHIITGHRNKSKKYKIDYKRLCSRCLMSEIKKIFFQEKKTNKMLN